jgi:hypothetical protein
LINEFLLQEVQAEKNIVVNYDQPTLNLKVKNLTFSRNGESNKIEALDSFTETIDTQEYKEEYERFQVN